MYRLEVVMIRVIEVRNDCLLLLCRCQGKGAIDDEVSLTLFTFQLQVGGKGTIIWHHQLIVAPDALCEVVCSNVVVDAIQVNRVWVAIHVCNVSKKALILC